MPSTDYMIIDYLYQGGLEAIGGSDVISFTFLLNDWWSQRPDGKEGSVRIARFLETILLAALVVDSPPGGENVADWPFDWEEVCEELALHFSIDVPLPTPFVEWLVRLRVRHPRARIALDILGWADDDDDDDANGGGSDGGTIGADSGPASNPNGNDDDNTGRADGGEGDDGSGDGNINDTGGDGRGNERNRAAVSSSGKSQREACRSGNGNGGGNRGGRRSMERLTERRGSLTTIDHGPGGESHSGTPGKRRCCLLRGSIIQVEIATGTSSGDHKRTDFITGSSTQTSDPSRSPQRTLQTRDPTVILATPPRLLAPPSRSSTPGCSQQVRGLSLEDD